ncbi:hypothetical protein [Streptomyces aurantiacus]|uniref:hypothetical protein n=1 Tax=Streptomyces aurantiacus TaxID=47760 RepID=UPI0027D7FBE9|nr:hypothetical protein [Streptomyces aurantiacus]
MQPLLGDHAELLAVLGEQVMVGSGVRAEFLVLAQQHENVRKWPSVLPDLAGTKKFSNVALPNLTS